MMQLHWKAFHEDAASQEIVNEMLRDMRHQEFDYEFLSLKASKSTRAPKDGWEKETLEKLQAQMKDQRAKWRRELARRREPDDGRRLKEFAQSVKPVFVERVLMDRAEYQYVQPVYWRGWERTCHNCHGDPRAAAAIGAEDAAETRPFHVVKIVIPLGSDE